MGFSLLPEPLATALSLLHAFEVTSQLDLLARHPHFVKHAFTRDETRVF
jgi:hypothetical protein